MIGVFVGFSRIFLLGILIFKGLTARRLYKSFGVKGLYIIEADPFHPSLGSASWSNTRQCRGRAFCSQKHSPCDCAAIEHVAVIPISTVELLWPRIADPSRAGRPQETEDKITRHLFITSAVRGSS
jgi:hypothetical protein